MKVSKREVNTVYLTNCSGTVSTDGMRMRNIPLDTVVL